MDHDALIVGAGISGLICARALTAAGKRVSVVDKGRGVGGRMATRRIDKAVFDHGAQFFTVKSKEFSALVEKHLERDDIAVWSRGFSNAIGIAFADGHPRYRGVEGMTSLPKALAKGLNVLVGEHVVQLGYESGRWLARTESGKQFTANSLVMTPPVPQSLDLISKNELKIDLEVEAQLSGVEYDRCIAVMIRLGRLSWIPKPGAYKLDIEPISWLADNHVKGISPERGALTIHLAPEASLAHWQSNEAEILKLIETNLPQLKLDKPKEIQIHRWRYSKPKELLDETTLFSEIPGPIYFAGDAFAGPRVEGAALSGLAAAEKILK